MNTAVPLQSWHTAIFNMQLHNYLDKPTLAQVPLLIPENQTLGHALKEIDKGIHQTDVALIGVAEDANSLYNKGCAKAPDIIRSYLYNLKADFSNIYISDLGNIKSGKGLNDSYFALQEIVEHCLENKVIPVIFGGSHDLSYPVYKAMEASRKTINVAVVDSTIDALSDTDLHDHSFVAHLKKFNSLNNLGILGYQAFQSHTSLDLELHRLKALNQSLNVAEPVLRDADFASFDLAAISAAFSPGNAIASPNGLNAEQFCKLAQYAGFSDRLSCFGIFGANPAIQFTHITEKLAAQAILFFLDGLDNRYKDFPLRDINTYSKKIVHQHDIDRGIVFYHNLKNNRWWFNAGTEEEKSIISCTFEDYIDTQGGKLPERIMRFLL